MEIVKSNRNETTDEIIIYFDRGTEIKGQKGKVFLEKIYLYGYAAELYAELEKMGIIARLKEIPQLGTIKVGRKYRKSRDEYVCLQLYLHQLINYEMKGDLERSYSNTLSANDFGNGFKYPSKSAKATIMDVIQILTIVYNIGHFRNTFASSRAMLFLLEESPAFKEQMLAGAEDNRLKKAADLIIREENYLRFHLLNSLLILERCDQNKVSVQLAKEIIYAYLTQSKNSGGEKLKFAFSVFREVRNISYMIYDLPIAKLPFMIDLSNKKDIRQFFHELLAEYNDNEPSRRLVYSMMKLLDDVLYNSNEEALRQHLIAKRIERKALAVVRESSAVDYFDRFFLDPESPLNDPEVGRKPEEFDEKGRILKLTFKKDEREVAKKLLARLERTNHVNAGSYIRMNGDITVLAAIKKNCDTHVRTAYRILQIAISAMRNCPTIKSDDDRYLLASKFFLYYLLGERRIAIEPTISEKTCVICTSGRRHRLKEIDAILGEQNGNEDQRHEIEFLRKVVETDLKNDTTILIPASILLFKNGVAHTKEAEFDGMILYPMRKEKQVIFLESKNTNKRALWGKRCLQERLDKLGISYAGNETAVDRRDAWLAYSL